MTIDELTLGKGQLGRQFKHSRYVRTEMNMDGGKGGIETSGVKRVAE
jgi:hypothetical protein